MELKNEENHVDTMLRSVLAENVETEVAIRHLHNVIPKMRNAPDENVWEWVNDGGLAKFCQFLDRNGFVCRTMKYEETKSEEWVEKQNRIRALAREVFDLLEALLTKCQHQDSVHRCLPQTVVTYLPLLLISAYSFADPDVPWSNEELRSLCVKLVGQLQKIFRCRNVGELVQIDRSSGLKKRVEIPDEVKGTVFERVLSQLHPQLQRDAIISHPCAVTAFSQLLLCVQHPMLSGFVGHVLPLALLVLDDYTKTHTQTGAVCIGHLMEACTSEAIRRNNAGLVMFDALKKLYKSRPDPEVLEKVASVWVQVACRSEAPSQCQHPQAPLKSEVLCTFLLDIEVERDVEKRQIVLAALVAMIPSMGLCLTKHLQLLFTSLLRSLEVKEGKDEEARRLTVQALCSTMLVAWPRMHNHTVAVTKALLRLLLELAMSEKSTQGECVARLRRSAIAALALLLRCCPDQVRPALDSVVAAEDLAAGVRLAVREVLDAKQGADELSQMLQSCS